MVTKKEIAAGLLAIGAVFCGRGAFYLGQRH